MDREQVDGWLAGVDELLDGGRDDSVVSGDAMRWSPTAPQRPARTRTLPPPQPPARLPTPAEMQAAAEDIVGALRPVMLAWGRMVQQFGTQVNEAVKVLQPLMAERPVPVDDRYRRAIEAARSRDTGPALPPLGRRFR